MNKLTIGIALLVVLTGCGGGNSNNHGDTNTTLNGVDTQPPVITIKGKNPIYRAIGSGYVDEGATVNDAVDGVVTVIVTGEVDTSTVGTYEIIYRAVDKAGNKATAVRKVIVQNIVHNGVTYGIIESNVTGRIWLDRNLGAAEPCTSSNMYDYDACEGDFYQWGRNADGHEDSMSATRTSKIDGVESSDGRFVIGHADWSTSTHRGANWSKIDGSSICPIGFRVPTMEEFKKEFKSLYTTARNIYHLNIPFTRERLIDGKYSEVPNKYGQLSALWTTTITEAEDYEKQIHGPGAYALWLSVEDNTYGAMVGSFRAKGIPVRCIKP